MSIPLYQLITKVLFSLWLCSLPFYLYSLVGSLSLDNLLVPFLFVLLLFRFLFVPGSMKRWKIKIILVAGVLFGIYACGRLFSVVERPEYFWFTAEIILKQFLYFILPILYIDTHSDLMYVSKIIVLVAIVGIFSALLASLGIVEFPVERFAESRIGMPSLKKAIGLFPNFGDMALLGSFSFLFLYVIGYRDKDNKLSFQLLKYAVTLFLLAGYLGAQSRNMYLTLVCGILFAIYFRIALNQNTAVKILLSNFVILGCIFIVALFTFLEVSALESLKGFGGTKEAAATVDARLEQYNLAWHIFKTNPYFGHAINILDAKIEIHNIWLKLMALGGIVSTTAVVAMFLVPFTSLFRHNYSRIFRNERIFALTQLVCVFVAAEFYGAMTYIFLVVLGILTTIPSVLKADSKTRHSPSMR